MTGQFTAGPGPAGRRPGGLTALAVINFVFAGFGLLSVLALVALMQFMGDLKADASAQDRVVFQAFEDMGMGLWALIVITSIVSSALLLIAGVGYLKQRPWGKLTGNLYGLTAIASSLLSALVMPSALGGGFNIGTIIGLVYPILTLALINTTFKGEFGRES
jgi:hypothetical protein